jgi:hypothetical protein
MLNRTNQVLFAAAIALGAMAAGTGQRVGAQDVEPGEEDYQGCSPCANAWPGGVLVHNWTPACCYGGSDCYWFPDANGSSGSCQGMHRPCTD